MSCPHGHWVIGEGAKKCILDWGHPDEHEDADGDFWYDDDYETQQL